MCFNCVIISSNDRIKLTNRLLKGLIGKMNNNPHGYAIYSYPPSNLTRTLSFKKALRALLGIRRSKYAHLHFRFATSGTISYDNVHLWEVEGMLVSHNGVVLGYSGVKDGKSDTRQLVESGEFKEALRERDFNKLWDVLREKMFSGVMLITSRDFSEIYVIAKNKQPYRAKYKNMVIISNDYLIGGERLGEGVYRITESGEAKEIVKVERVTLEKYYDRYYDNNGILKYPYSSFYYPYSYSSYSYRYRDYYEIKDYEKEIEGIEDIEDREDGDIEDVDREDCLDCKRKRYKDYDYVFFEL